MNRNFIFLIISVFILSSCEYELKEENFINIETPPETQLFSISLNDDNDTIKVFSTTEFSYYIYTNDLELLSGKFILSNTVQNINSRVGSFYIDPKDYTPGVFKLKLTAYTNSGSGSISDRSGAEGYLIEKEWILIIDSRPAPKLTVYKSITPEGYLKITWDKCDQYNFKKYQLKGDFISKDIYDINNTSYIDSNYIGGDAYFRMCTYVYPENRMTWGDILDINDSYAYLQFKNMGIDSVLIYWNNSPYNCKYKLEGGFPTATILDFSTDTSIIVPQPGYGTKTYFTLYTYPKDLHEYDNRYVKKDDASYHFGQSINMYSWCDYNMNSKTLYYNYSDDLLCLDIELLTLLNSVNIDVLRSEGRHACPTNSNKIAALTGNSIYVFDNENLQNPIIIPYNPTSSGFVDYFYFCDNDIIAIAENGKYDLVSVDSKDIIGSLEIEDYSYYSIHSYFSTSKDGKYMSYVSDNGMKIYSIENGNFTLHYTDPRRVRSVLFDIFDPNQIYVTFFETNDLEIRSVSDFSLIKAYELPTIKNALMNIDPESGFLVLTDYNFVYLLNLINSEIVFKIKSSASFPRVYNNRIFSRTGYTFDITNYL